LNWSGGTMSGTGLTLLTPGATFGLAPASGSVTLSRTLENQTAATWTSGTLWVTGGTFLNKGTLTTTTTGILSAYGAGGTNQFLNQGAVVKQGTGTMQFAGYYTGMAFNNTGVVDVQGGALSLVSGGTHTGDFTLSGSTLFVNGAQTFQSTSDVTGTGTLRIDGGTANFSGTVQVGAITSNGTTSFGPVLQTSYVAVGAGTTTINTALSLNQLDLSGGTLTGSGNLTISGVLNWSGGTMSGTGRTVIGPSGTLLMNANTVRTLSRVLENQGTATWSVGNFQLTNGNVLNTGTFIANAGGTLQFYGGLGGTNNRFTNQGTFRKQGAGAANFFTSSSSVIFENQGTIDVQTGTLSLLNNSLLNFSGTTLTGGTYLISGTGILQFTGANIVTNAANIILSGTAATPIISDGSANGFANFATNAATGSFSLQGGRDFTRTGNFTNNGALSLGPGSIFTVSGAYTQPGTGAYKAQIGGPTAGADLGLLAVSGAATLDGTLTIELVNGFVPVLGQTFDIMTYGSCAGDFANVTGIDFRPGLRFQRELNATNMRLTVVEAGVAPGPTVIASTPADNGTAAPGTFVYEAQFSETMATGNLGLEDVRLRDTLTGATHTPVAFEFTAATNRLRVTYLNLPESEYELTLVSSDTGFRGVTGNRLDGDGDGHEGGDYLVNVRLDTSVRPLTAPTQPIIPAGSTIYQTPTTTPTAANLSSGLVSWWKADGSPAESADGNTGTLQNGATFGQGQIGQAFQFDGVDDYINIPDSATLDSATTAISASAWIKPEVPVDADGGFIFSRRDPTLSEGFSVSLAQDGSIQITVRTSTSPTVSGSIFRSASGVITFGQFQHVAAAVDTSAGTARMWVNGREIAVTTILGPSTVSGTLTNVNQHYIGRRQDPALSGNGGHFRGLIDDVRLYNRAITTAEVEALAGYLSPGGRFHGAGDIDAHTLNLSVGQTISFRLTPQDPSIQVRLEVVGTDGTTVLGTVDAVAPGAVTLLQTIPVTTAGTYTIRVTALAGAGTYQLSTTLNSALEAEQFGRSTNNIVATAQDLASSAIALQGTATRLAVTGATEAGQSDYYRFDLTAGQAATIVLSAADLDANLTVELRDGSNGLLATGIKETANIQNQAIRNFVAPTAGSYYVSVSGEANRAYSIVVTKSAEFDRESNSTVATAQDISVTSQVLGSLGVKTETNPGQQIKVAVVGATDPSHDSHFTALVNQLNDDTFFDFNATFVRPSQIDTLAELQAYNVVILANAGLNPPQDNFESFAPALRQWVEAGGGVVALGYTVYAGSTTTGTPVADIDAIVPVHTSGTPTTTFSQLFAPNVHIENVSHPIVVGVPDFTLPNPAVAEAPEATPKVDPGAVLLGSVSGKPILAAGSVALGRSAYLGLVYTNTSQSHSDLRQAGLPADRLLEQAVAWAAGTDRQDQYLVRANAGDVLTITTSTPGGAANTLNPKIELFTQSGTTVLASDLNSAADGRNARIASFNVTTTGVYRIVVSAESGAGDYTLHVTGATGAPVPFTVASQSVPNGELRATYPTTFRVDLSEPVLLSSIQASDLQIQRLGVGAPVSADSITIIDQETIEFMIATAQTGDGIYTLTIPASAFTSLTNQPLQTAFTSTFDLDATPPRVFNANLIEGATVAPDANGNLTVNIQFTEPLATLTPPVSGLISWWKADGSANDSQDGNTGTLQNGATFTTGISGQGFSFDGIDDFVQVADNPNLDPGAGSFTVEAWIQTTKTVGTQMIVTKYEGSATIISGVSNSLYFLYLQDGRLGTTIRDSQARGQTLSGQSVLSDGLFHHVAMQRDVAANQLRLYVDGALEAQAALTAIGTIRNDDGTPDALVIGTQYVVTTTTPTTMAMFSGVIDEVKYYNRALAAAELGVVLGPADVTLRDTLTNATFTPATFNYNLATNSLTLTYSNLPDSAYALTLLSSATGFRDLRGHLLDGDANGTAGGNWVRSFGVDTTIRNYPAALQPLAPAGGLIYTDNVPASNSGLMSWWQGEGNAADSADGNSGSLQGGATFATGQIGQAFQFDGIDDYVNIPDSTTLDSLTTAATVSMWVKPEAPGYVFSRREPLVLDQLSIGVEVGGSVVFLVGTQSAVSGYRTAQNVVSFGSISHIALAVDTTAGIVKLYVNGISTPFTTVVGPTTPTGSFFGVNNLFLGRRQSSATSEGAAGAAHYKGLVDDVRLYNRTLTANEVAAQAGRLPVAGRFNSIGDVDAYTLNLDAGQKLSVTLKPGDAFIQGVISILDPNGALIGTATAGSAGATVFLQSVPVALSGVYTLQVSSQAGSGAYSLSTTLNATVEAESFGGATNNALASAADLMPSAVALQGSATRLAVTGQTEPGTPDIYRFELSAGQAATVVLTPTDRNPLLQSLELLDGTGILLASGFSDSANVDRTIRSFVAPTSGTYFIRVGAGSNRSYSLVVTRQADFERRPDGTSVTVQDLSLAGQVLGAFDSRDILTRSPFGTAEGPVRVAVLGLEPGSGNSTGPNNLAGQLNDKTHFNFIATVVAPSQIDSVAELQNYDVVVISHTGNHNNQLTGIIPALRTWVEAGGGLVTAGWAIAEAQSASASAIVSLDAIVPVAMQPGNSYYWTPSINATVENHPVTTGVTTFTAPLAEFPPSSVNALDIGATLLGNASGAIGIAVSNPGLGRSVYLAPTYGYSFGNPFLSQTVLQSDSADRLLEQAVAWAGARDQVDQYLVQATAGQLQITTTTPGGDTGEPNNTLVPKLELFTSSGLLVASNQNGAPDGRNAQIVYQVPTGSAGSYRIVVTAVSGAGEYTLAATGTAVVSQHIAPTVVATTPVNGARLAAPPTTIDLTFSEGIRIDSISASDLQISGGGTVTAVQALDGKIFRFTVSVPDVPNADMTYTMTLAAGAVLDLQGHANGLFTSTFVVDHVGPRITAQTPAVQASSPWNALTVAFSEPINAASFTAADVVLTGPGGTIPITSITGAGTTFRLNFASQTTAGAYTLTIGPTITDTVGNLMDQNNNGINGESGAADAYTSTVLLQAPNLRVVTVTTNPVSAAQFGQPVTVTWTVENAGTDPAREVWSDQIWLSTNQTLEPSTDTPLGNPIPSGLTGPLNALGTYTKTAAVTLPLTTVLPAGTYSIIVETDTGKTQLETNEADNTTASAPLTLTVPPLPDLVVTNMSGPATARPGELVPIAWTVTNNGGADATGTWTDFVFLSSDNASGGDRFIASFSFTGTIAVGQSVVRTQNLRMPTDVSGTQRLVVQTDAAGQIYEHNNENNNSAIDDQVITMIAPDLQVSNIQLPALSFSGQPITVTWTLTNNGTADFTGTFSDRLSLSSDATIGSDTFAADVPFTGTLAIGQSVQRSHTFTLDRNLSGQRWAVVSTDISGQVLEYPNEGNNAAISAQPTNVTLQFSDLAVESVAAPATAQSGDPIQVTWRVRNQGSLPTDGSSWTDQIILSTDAVLDAGDMTRINVAHTGALAIDAAYTGQATVTLPQGIAGEYYIFVQIDIAGQVFESTAESNNVSRTLTPTTVSLKPYPDFQVTSVTGPMNAQPGQTATISWTVANNGTGPAAAQRVDYVYLSLDGTLTGATFLTAATITSTVSNGGSYNASATVTIPPSMADGTYRFVIVTDATNALYEGPFGGETNNLGQSAPVQVTHPDLQVAILSAPNGAASGATVSVEWSATNNGSGPAQGSWIDRVYLSTDGTVDNNDLVRGELVHTGPLAAGGTYTGHFDVLIPIDRSGPFFLLVKTDAALQVTETTAGNAEGNNVALSPITVSLSPYADLETYNVTVDNQVVGNPAIVTVGWSVQNALTGTATAATWTDAVIASTDAVVGNSDDTVLATYTHTGLLALGSSYIQSQTFYLPFNFQGRYYIFVKTDSAGTVFENAKEANNTAEAANVLDVLPVLYADLRVDSITVPEDGQSGASLRVSWTVSNQGIGITNQVTWSDRVYLASDAQGLSVVQEYGYLDHSGPLQPLAT